MFLLLLYTTIAVSITTTIATTTATASMQLIGEWR